MLSPAALQAVEQAATIELAKRDFSYFIDYDSDFRDANGKHLDVLDETLMKVSLGELRRVIVTMPPRHGKSERVSKKFPAWHVGRNPGDEIILASYSVDLSRGFSRIARDTLTQHEDVFGVKIDPNNQSAESWGIEGHRGGVTAAGVGGPITGKGARCFPAGTMVQTAEGPMEIKHLCSMQNPPLIWSYDHKNGKLVLRKILASQRKWADELVNIRTSCGREITSTVDHRIYVSERGYREAHLLKRGDRLHSITFQQDMYRMRTEQKWARTVLQKLLQGNTEEDCYSKLLILQKAVRAFSIRIREICQEWAKRCLLLTGLQPITSCGKEQSTLPGMWSQQEEKERHVLLTQMSSGYGEKKSRAEIMSRMQNGVSAKIEQECLLQQDMRKCSAFETDGRQEQLPFQGWGKLFKVVQGNATGNFRTRWIQMRWMRLLGNDGGHETEREDRETVVPCYPPYQRKCKRQHNAQSDNHVQDMSSESPQINGDAVSSINTIRCGSVSVYDIQIEGTSNFFANEILVHNCAIIDDPVKNAEEANSEVMREKVWEWYQSTLYTRLTPDGRIIIVMTRWHEDDLVGRLLKKEREEIKAGTHVGERWTVINFPAIAEEEDYLGRSPGEPLWPEFGFDKPRLEQIRSDVGSYVFNALYQQRPSAAGGTIFKRQHFHYFREETIHSQQYFIVGEKRYEKNKLWAFQTVDTANSEKTINDYFVVSTWYVTPSQDLLLYDVYRTHITGPDQKPLMKEQSYRYRPRFQAIEDKTFGTNLIQECKREGMTIRAVKVDKDKVTRSLVIAARYEVGKVYHRENAPWLTDFEDELLSFPRGKHDDQVDTASMAGEIVHGMVHNSEPWTAVPDKKRRFEDEDEDKPQFNTFW